MPYAWRRGCAAPLRCSPGSHAWPVCCAHSLTTAHTLPPSRAAGRKKRRAARLDGNASDGSDDMATHDDTGRLILHHGANPLADLAAAFMQLMAPAQGARGGPAAGGAGAPGPGGLAHRGSNGRSDVILTDMGDALPDGLALGAAQQAQQRHSGGAVPIILEPGPSSAAVGFGAAAAAAGGVPGAAAPGQAMPSILLPAPGAGVALGGAGAAPLITSIPLAPAGGPAPVPSFPSFIPLPSMPLGQPAASASLGGGGAAAAAAGPSGGSGSGGAGAGVPGLTITEVTSSPMIDMHDLDGFDLCLDDAGLDMLPLPDSQVGLGGQQGGRVGSARGSLEGRPRLEHSAHPCPAGTPSRPTGPCAPFGK